MPVFNGRCCPLCRFNTGGLEFARGRLGGQRGDGTGLELEVEAEAAGQRIDVFLVMKGLYPPGLQKLIDDNQVLVNHRPVKSSHKLMGGERVVVEIPPPKPLAVEPEEIPLDVLYEDEHIIVVNKPRGMVVHPAAGNPNGTLVNALLAHCSQLSGIGGVLRPGIVHRLDKDTTGSTGGGQERPSSLGLARQIKEQTVKRQYVAIVHGNVKEDGGPSGPTLADIPESEGDGRIARGKGKVSAVTHFSVLEVRSIHLAPSGSRNGQNPPDWRHMAHLGQTPSPKMKSMAPREAAFPLRDRACMPEP